MRVVTNVGFHYQLQHEINWRPTALGPTTNTTTYQSLMLEKGRINWDKKLIFAIKEHDKTRGISQETNIPTA
jgi:hypothetical protein